MIKEANMMPADCGQANCCSMFFSIVFTVKASVGKGTKSIFLRGAPAGSKRRSTRKSSTRLWMAKKPEVVYHMREPLCSLRSASPAMFVLFAAICPVISMPVTLVRTTTRGTAVDMALLSKITAPHSRSRVTFVAPGVPVRDRSTPTAYRGSSIVLVIDSSLSNTWKIGALSSAGHAFSCSTRSTGLPRPCRSRKSALHAM
mmetsp:Transcript_45107/g.130244  ORF Transcript_45107/g.130244 Transcript_45107/m.130244 type:complete len:201 (-) Transcript_45107:1036-1638(-)